MLLLTYHFDLLTYLLLTYYFSYGDSLIICVHVPRRDEGRKVKKSEPLYSITYLRLFYMVTHTCFWTRLRVCLYARGHAIKYKHAALYKDPFSFLSYSESSLLSFNANKLEKVVIKVVT